MTTHRLLYGLADLPETRFDDAPPEPRRDRLERAAVETNRMAAGTQR
ncbi:MAG: hypothetical protein QOE36_3122 [Gaiellaceae bacterium]|nr:hypothetical protein [Gaiellaceae bacterium]